MAKKVGIRLNRAERIENNRINKKLKMVRIAVIIIILLNVINVGGLSIGKALCATIVYHVENLKCGSLTNAFLSTDEAIENWLAYGDEETLKSFEDGGTVTVISVDETEINPMNANGLIVYKQKTIYMQDKLLNRVANVALHELGHYADVVITQGRSDPNFISAAEAEISRFSLVEHLLLAENMEEEAETLTGDWSEYYASTFADYFTHPLFLKMVAPQTYQYFEEYYGAWAN